MPADLGVPTWDLIRLIGSVLIVFVGATWAVTALGSKGRLRSGWWTWLPLALGGAVVTYETLRILASELL